LARKTETKRHIIAAGVVSGQSTEDIARSAGCSVRQVQRIASDMGTQLLITEAFAPHTKKLAKLATRVLYVIEKALLAHKDDNADHATRLKAVERYGDVLAMAQGKAPETTAEVKTQFTWEEFQILYQSRRTNIETDPPQS